MQTTETTYTIVKGSAADDELEKYRVCFQVNGTERDMANLTWLHHQNLPRKNAIYYAMKGDEIAAIYTALPVLFSIDGKILPALQSIDTLTDTHHRGKGLFIKLANRLYAEEGSNHFQLIYGFPNENSAPGFFSKLGWQSFGEVPVLFRPVNPMYFLKKLFKGKKHTDFSSRNHVYNAPGQKELKGGDVIRQIDEFGASYDQVWNKAVKKIRVCVNRNAAYMNWRYVEKPGEHYYRYGLYNQGQLCGCIVFCIKHKHDGLIGYLMELVIDPDLPRAAKALFRFANRQFKEQKTDVVLAWSIPGSMNHEHYKNAGYYLLPEKLRPQKLYLGMRGLDATVNAVASDRKNWFISYSDSDTA